MNDGSTIGRSVIVERFGGSTPRKDYR